MGRLARVAPVFAAILVLGAQPLLPATALANGGGVVYPPGNSGVSQYDEDLPTVHGDKPTSSVVVPTHTGGSGGSGGSGSATSSASGSATSGGSTGSRSLSASSSGEVVAPVVPTAVVKKLSRDGNAGKDAAALAEATAQPPTESVKVRTTPTPQAPATSVIKALGGSSAGGGLGTLLPVLLIAALVIVSAVGLLQRRRST